MKPDYRPERRPESVSAALIAYIGSQDDFDKLRIALDSVVRNRMKAIVFDNASPAPWCERVSALAVSFGLGYRRRETNNLGAARDQALRDLSTEYIAFVDADVELPEGWISSLLMVLCQSPDRHVVGIASALLSPLDSTFDRGMRWALGTSITHLQTAQVHGPHRPTEVSHLATAAVLYRRLDILQAGGFSDAFIRVGEDLELSHRLCAAGTLLLLPQPAVLHRQDRSLVGWARRVFRYGWAQVEVARVHRGHFRSRKLIPLLFGGVLIGLTGLATSGFPRPLMATTVLYALAVSGGLATAKGRAGRPLRWSDFATAAGVVVTTHLAYSAGLWAGILGLFRNRHYSESR